MECGVNRGGLSRTVIEYVGFSKLKKRFYLVDTYQGLVRSQITAAELERGIGEYSYAECYDLVKGTFSEYPNVFVVRGVVPDVLPTFLPPRWPICRLT